jgi:glucans biosynthesis protein C
LDLPGVGLALTVGFVVTRSFIGNPNGITSAVALMGVFRIWGGWSMVLAILGLGMQYLTARTPLLEYANEAVLPFYILHQTVLLTVGYFVLPFGLPDVLAAATIAVVSLIIIMAFYECLVRRWNVVRFLFGMKPLPPRPAEEAMQPQFGRTARAR